MIIEHRQRMRAFIGSQRIMAFEVHLPKLIRTLLFEALKNTTVASLRRPNPIVAQQDGVDGASRYRLLLSLFEARFDLTRAPSVLVAHRQDVLLHFPFTAPRRMVRSSRKVLQASYAALL